MEGGVKRSIPKIKIPTIKGSKFISHYAKYLISSGVPALDHNLGIIYFILYIFNFYI